ncbi:hypothetical protein ACP275_10G104700 [Erythranthe tilingii]
MIAIRHFGGPMSFFLLFYAYKLNAYNFSLSLSLSLFFSQYTASSVSHTVPFSPLFLSPPERTFPLTSLSDAAAAALKTLHHHSPHADLERRSTRSRRFRRRRPSTLHLLPPTGQLRHRPEIALAHSPLDLHLQEQTNLFELMLPLSIIEISLFEWSERVG